MPEKLKTFLSSAHGSIICFTVAFLAKVGLIRIFLDVGPDKLGQLLMARNFLQGHGISIDQSAFCNLSQKFYSPAIGWPPGYSFFMMPFLLISNDHLMIGCYILDCLTAILFFLFLRKTLLLIQFPLWLSNLFLLFSGFFINNYIVSSTPTDFLGITFLLALVYYCIKTAKSSVLSFKLILLLVLFSVLGSLTRHQNFPASILLLLTMAGVGTIQKKKNLLQSSFISLAIIAIFYAITVVLFHGMFQQLQTCGGNVYCGAGLMYRQTHTGKIFQQYAASKGFFPSNLKYIYPFIVDGFINLNFYAVQLSNLAGAYTDWFIVAQVLNFIILIILITVFIRFLFLKQFNPKNNQELFWIFGGIAAVGIVGLLIFLSLLNDNNIWPTFDWTFVKEGRYYAFPVLFLQIVAWQWLFLRRSSTLFKKSLKWLLITAIFIEGAHGVYFLSKRISNPNYSLNEFADYDRGVNNFIIDFIRDQKEKDSTVHVVVSTFHFLPGFVADWYGASAQFEPIDLYKAEPQATEPTLLLIVLHSDEIIVLNKFLRGHQVQLIKQLGNNYFYECQIKKY